MKKEKHVDLERMMTPGGIVVHGLRYESSALQRLHRLIGTKSVKVKVIDPGDVSSILVWDSHDRVWFEVPIAQVSEFPNPLDTEIVEGFYRTRVLQHPFFAASFRPEPLASPVRRRRS